MTVRVYAVNDSEERPYDCVGIVFDFTKQRIAILLDGEGFAIDIPLPPTLRLPDGFCATELRVFSAESND